MALIGNYTNLNRTIGRPFFNTTSGSVVHGTPETVSPKSAFKNRFYGAFSKLEGTPNGYVHPGSWVMPLVGGSMSSYRQLDITITETLATIAAGRNITANLDGSFNITNAMLDQIANMVANITGSINVTDAQLAAVLSLQASITASMTITDAQLGAIIDMLASLSGSFNLTNAGNFATANISADMSVTTGTATPQQIAAEVWDTVLADHLTSGSTGAGLFAAGGGTTPSDIASEIFDTQEVETGYSMRNSLRLILSALAGRLTGAGDPMGTVKIRDMNDTVNRIQADYDSNGNRINVTTDVS